MEFLNQVEYCYNVGNMDFFGNKHTCMLLIILSNLNNNWSETIQLKVQASRYRDGSFVDYFMGLLMKGFI